MEDLKKEFVLYCFDQNDKEGNHPISGLEAQAFADWWINKIRSQIIKPLIEEIPDTLSTPRRHAKGESLTNLKQSLTSRWLK